MNKYKQLHTEYLKAQSAFNDYLDRTVEVDLSLMRSELPSTEVIRLHQLMERYNPDLILSSMLSHGGVDCMKLVATREEIVDGLELIRIYYDDKRNTSMSNVLNSLIDPIEFSDKTVFSLSKMLKQLKIND